MKKQTTYIHDWLNSPSADFFLEQESLSFEKISKPCVGSTGLQLTLSDKCDYLSGVNVSKRFFSCPNIARFVQSANGDCLFADVNNTPFPNSAFSVVVAPRLSLYSSDVAIPLKEIHRITASEGYVLVSGINPYSLIGLQGKLLSKSFPFSSLISLNEMKSTLSSFGFDIVGGDFFHYSILHNSNFRSPLFKKIEKIGNRWFPLYAGGYWLLAKKRDVSRITRLSNDLRGSKTVKMTNAVASKHS